MSVSDDVLTPSQLWNSFFLIIAKQIVAGLILNINSYLFS